MKVRLIITTLLVMVFAMTLTAKTYLPVSKGADDVKDTEFAQKMTKADFLAKVMDFEKNTSEWKFKGDKPCVIDFYADWCGPCRITSPILEELAKEYQGKINVYKINVDNERELSQVFGISGIPAFLYCPIDGKPSMTSGIAKDKEQTKQMFIQNIETLLLKNKQ